MKVSTILTAAALALCGAAASAAPDPAHAHQHPADPGATGGSSCFRTQDIRAHTFDGDDTIYLRVNIKDVYRVQTSGRCLAGHMRDDPLVIDRGPPSGQICRPVEFSLKIGRQGDLGGATPCIVSSIKKLTPAEAAALPKKVRP